MWLRVNDSPVAKISPRTGGPAGVVGRPQVPSRGGHGLQLTRTRSAGGTIPTITGGASRAPAVPGRTLRGLWCWQLGDECRTFDGSLSGSIERAVMPAPRRRSRGRRSRSCDGRCGGGRRGTRRRRRGMRAGVRQHAARMLYGGDGLCIRSPLAWRGVCADCQVCLCVRGAAGAIRVSAKPPDLHPSQSTTSPDPAERRRLLPTRWRCLGPAARRVDRRWSDYTSVTAGRVVSPELVSR